jgi:uncharacterized membrane protein
MVELMIRYCAGAGILITAYFLLMQYRLVRPENPRIPRWCRLGADGCASLLDSPESRIFGIPNTLVALVFYAAALILPFHPFEAIFLVGSIFSAALGVYLSFVLLHRMKIPCALCFTIHTLNIVLAILFIIHASQWHGL